MELALIALLAANVVVFYFIYDLHKSVRDLTNVTLSFMFAMGKTMDEFMDDINREIEEKNEK